MLLINESKLNDLWYHLVPKGSDTSIGIISPYAMKQLGNDELFLKATDKYRDRLVNGWGYYRNKKPNQLTATEIERGLIKYRGENGLKAIYLFKYPPYSKLGPNMAKLLKSKDLYEIDISKIKNIIEIDYGRFGNHSDSTPISKEWYDNISRKDYFADYDDNNPMIFSTINHISIATEDGIIHSNAIKKVRIN